MQRLLAFSVVAAAAVVAAVVGLAGNPSFAETVPVRVPAHAHLEDDAGGKSNYLEPGDDKHDESRHTEHDDSRHNGAGSAHHGDDDFEHHGGDDSRHSREGSSHS